MGDLDWLDGLFGAVRCANCGATYGKDAITVVGNREDYWFVRCACGACGTQGLGVVIVKETKPTLTSTPEPVSPGELTFAVDDVLEAHEFLKTYRGDIHGLFDTGRSRQGR